MKNDRTLKAVLRIVSRYFTFFILVAFVITSCLLVFANALSDSLGVTFTSENISTAAKLTFCNVIAISLIFTAVDEIRRRFTVNRPVKMITEAADRMLQGDFSVRLRPVSKFIADDTFNEVINSVNRIAEELGSVEMLRTDFISDVSHEMKTPLAVIRNYGVLLRDPEISDAQRKEYADGIVNACGTLSETVTNILRLNRLENQSIYPEHTVYDIGEQLCECLLQYESLWESRGIDVEADIEPDVTVCADSELLSLVWNNLLSNAFKFTERGGKVSLALASDGEYITVTVSDTGCGMSQEVGSHIFEKFYQGDTSHATEGNGLGLALVKRIVDIIHGEISVSSVLGEGTAFTVKIRRRENEHREENK